MTRTLLLVCIFCIAITLATNVPRVCPTLPQQPCVRTEGANCILQCGELRYQDEFFACPTKEWETSWPDEECKNLNAPVIAATAPQQSTATVQNEADRVSLPPAKIVERVKELCVRAGCVIVSKNQRRVVSGRDSRQ